MVQELSELDMRILRHLRSTRTDYAFSIARSLGADMQSVMEELERMERMGLIRRVFGRGLKRTRAKAKRSPEVTKHHTYYELTREGKRALSEEGNMGSAP
nr:conserved hypothetical protein [uncultured archaeon]